MLDRLFRHPKLLLAVFLGATLALGWQARHFEINASADTLIADDNIHFLESRDVAQRFAPEEFLLLVYQPDDGKIFSEQSQKAIQALADKLSALERVATVRTILNVPLLSQMDGLSAEIDPDQYTQSSLNLPAQKLAEIFRDHPVYEGLIINPEQNASAIQLLFKENANLRKLESRELALKQKALQSELSATEQKELAQLEADIEPLLSELREQRNSEVQQILALIKPYEKNADIYLGGLQVLGYELISIIKRDLLLFGSAIAVSISVMLLLLFRSLRWVLVPMVCCASSVAITLGLFGLMGLKATVISSSFVALQLILTLAIVIHLIVQYRETEQEQPNANQRELVLTSLKRKLAPCFYAGLTTSVGFASLLLSGIQPVISFGWMMVIAMAISIACSLLLMPAINLLLPKQETPSRNSLFRWFINRCHWLATQRAGSLYLVCTLLAVGLTFGLVRLDVENSFINYFDKGTRIYKELRYVDQTFGGSTPLDIIYSIPQVQQADTPTLSAQTVQTLQQLQHAIEQHHAVGTTLSVVNFTELAKQINDGKPLTEYELTALYRTLDRSVREDLVGAFFSPDTQQLRISTRIQDSTENLDRKALLQDIKTSIADLGIDTEAVQITGLFVLYQQLLEQLFNSQILTLGAVFAALGAMFLMIFRSLKVAIIALIPNALTALAILGLMGWLGVPLDFMTITTAAIAVGIAVDDTIHYVHRYREEQHSDEPTRRTHDAIGYALLYTSIIVICGFSLLLFSDFTPSVMFGLFTALAMAVAMITDLTLLPAMLERFVRKAR